ncbi:helix-turn-helix domain-containing protein [Vescimonas sp.]
MSERERPKPEEKVKIVIKYIAGEVSISGTAAEDGVDRKTLQRWVMQYEAEGAATFLLGRREHIYSPELKLQAVQEYLSGKGSQAELSKKYGLRDRRQLRNWLKVYNAHGDFNSRKNSGGGSYMKQGRDAAQEERIQIVKDCLSSGKN